MGKGDGKTPKRVMELLKKEVAATSQAAVSRATGLGLATINDYLKGKGEPTLKTLEKLADYFRVSVSFLRGEDDLGLPATLRLFDIFFEFLESLPEDRQGPAMLFSMLWFEENWYQLSIYLRAAPDDERDNWLKKTDVYINKCLEIKGKFRNWQIETGGLLGEWQPYEQDIVIQLDNEQNSGSGSIYASPSGKVWEKILESSQAESNAKQEK